MLLHSLIRRTITETQKASTRVMSSSSSSLSQPQQPVYTAIHERLTTAFSPITHLEIINESHKHNVPEHSETHFKVLVVSSAFDNEPSLMARHRLVHAALSEQLAGPVHALSIVAKTPAQFHAMTEGQTTFVMEPSPNCRGGDGSLPPKKGH